MCECNQRMPRSFLYTRGSTRSRLKSVNKDDAMMMNDFVCSINRYVHTTYGAYSILENVYIYSTYIWPPFPHMQTTLRTHTHTIRSDSTCRCIYNLIVRNCVAHSWMQRNMCMPFYRRESSSRVSNNRNQSHMNSHERRLKR